jgi:hypothetical protein
MVAHSGAEKPSRSCLGNAKWGFASRGNAKSAHSPALLDGHIEAAVEWTWKRDSTKGDPTMVTDRPRAKAAALRALQADDMLVLPNAWDAASAALIAAGGAQATATTSAGVSWSLGRPDGQNLTRTEMIDAVARIAATVDLPVSADVEGGYGPGAGDVGAPSVDELRRVSVGQAIAQAAYSLARRAAVEAIDKGTFDSLADADAFGDVNGAFTTR